jgi:hypothetical protein
MYTAGIVDVNGNGKLVLLIQGFLSEFNYVGNYKVIYNNGPSNPSPWASSTLWTAATGPYGSMTGNNGFVFMPGDTTNSTFIVDDLNSDHINDLIVSAPNATVNGNANAGSTFIIWGHNASYTYPNGGLFDTSAPYQNTSWVELGGDHANENAGFVLARVRPSESADFTPRDGRG